ncbi:RNA polymerase sigma factor [Sedimentibacter hydroxybenzoicus DSM 7310]|uniref:RNA polymerase sigma factor n=1 Tax=Sedimentibacter hydroxybenzoicus DSM 7310 TaxID=1123245 RepID=A0A974BJ21_SEDHY|nr:RNA polymerase sigma factor [Sedimentibacter hydroxybenzoicus]NYB74104.1 RNA polymerase sigma factor [Sedimentibacter hydroxybenzoicus DSM 7310]
MFNDQLETLYIKYHRELYLYAFSLCKDYHLAQDLTSETFFKAILSLDDNVTYIKYWLFRVCKNLFIDNARKDKEYSNTEGLEDTLTSAITPLDRLIESEDKKHLYNQVINLHHTYREILILYYYCDFTLNEICKTTGITTGSAKTLLFRARKKLKIKLEGKNEI